MRALFNTDLSDRQIIFTHDTIINNNLDTGHKFATKNQFDAWHKNAFSEAKVLKWVNTQFGTQSAEDVLQTYPFGIVRMEEFSSLQKFITTGAEKKCPQGIQNWCADKMKSLKLHQTNAADTGKNLEEYMAHLQTLSLSSLGYQCTPSRGPKKIPYHFWVCDAAYFDKQWEADNKTGTGLPPTYKMQVPYIFLDLRNFKLRNSQFYLGARFIAIE